MEFFYNVKYAWWYILFSLWNISFFTEKEKKISDNEIIKSIKNGNKNLYEKIVEKYSDKIFRYIYYQFNFSKEIAEELVQEVFLRVWEKIDTFNENTNFNAWIYKLTHNLVLNYIRKKKIEFIEKDIQDLNIIWENIKLDNIKHELFEVLFSKLNIKYKQILILYYFEEKSYDEIAKIFWTNKNTVWSWINRAKNKLKNIIEQDKKLKQAIEFDL